MPLFKKKEKVEQQNTQVAPTTMQQMQQMQQPIMQPQMQMQPIIVPEAPQEQEEPHFSLVEVATQTEARVKDNKSGNVVDVQTLLMEIANDIKEIKRYLVNS